VDTQLPTAMPMIEARNTAAAECRPGEGIVMSFNRSLALTCVERLENRDDFASAPVA
jgi:hypothetical protein